MTTNSFESYLIRTTFRLVIIGTVWHLFSNVEIKKPKKCYPSLKKFKNGPLKIKNSKIRARHLNSMLIQVQKNIWVQFQGTDSYPINECIYIYVTIYLSLCKQSADPNLFEEQIVYHNPYIYDIYTLCIIYKFLQRSIQIYIYVDCTMYNAYT